MSIDPPGIWTETLQSQLGIRARTNDESQLGIRPLFSITWSVKGHATISDVYLYRDSEAVQHCPLSQLEPGRKLFIPNWVSEREPMTNPNWVYVPYSLITMVSRRTCNHKLCFSPYFCRVGGRAKDGNTCDLSPKNGTSQVLENKGPCPGTEGPPRSRTPGKCIFKQLHLGEAPDSW